MDKKISFIEELNNQLKQYQLEKIIMAEERNQHNYPKLNQSKAKQVLIDLGDLNESSCLQENTASICRWNNKKDPYLDQQNPIITKRNNLMTERYHSSQNRLQSLRSFSTKQIPHLKQLLQKLSTPTNKKKRHTQQRCVLTSARRNKNHQEFEQRILNQKFQNNVEEQIIHTKGLVSQRKVKLKRQKTLQKKDSENKNPILYPVNQPIRQKSKLKEYQKINRKNSNYWNLLNNNVNSNTIDVMNEKQMLQNLIKNTISNPSGSTKINPQAALNFLGQYSNLNYFSSNFKNQDKKKSTLTNLLI